MKVTNSSNGIVLLRAVSLRDDKVNTDFYVDEVAQHRHQQLQQQHKNIECANKTSENKNLLKSGKSNSDELILNSSDLKDRIVVDGIVDKTFSQGRAQVERFPPLVEIDDSFANCSSINFSDNNNNNQNSCISMIKLTNTSYTSEASKRLKDSHDNPAFEFTDFKLTSGDETTTENTYTMSSVGESVSEQQKDHLAHNNTHSSVAATSSAVSYSNFTKSGCSSSNGNASSSMAMTDSITAASSTVGLFKRSEMYSVEQASALSRYTVSQTIPTRVTLSWNELTIRVKKKTALQRLASLVCPKKRGKYETILDGVKGLVQPGEMLALMGSSGSGKTTLLNALNFSVQSPLKVYGKIYINGAEADSTRMKIISSYIQQDDLFFGTLTVKEHLIFHAMLRMDKSISKVDKMKRVYQVLKEFNLDKRSNVKIGIPGRIKGISGGEKRRLSFASEILTDPPLLYCDEPTSGLDAYMAKSIIYYLQKMARSGKTIVCTIHQPSSEAFSIFDKICLLAQTRVAYFGTRENALNFFTKNLLKVYPPFTNPADFYMDVLGVDVNDSENSKTEIQRHCEVFNKSQYNHELVEQIESAKPQYFNIPSNYTHYKSTWCDQMFFLMQRCFFNYFRNHKVVINDLGMVIITALLGGSIFLNTSERENDTCYFDQRGVENVSFALYYTLTVCIIFSTLAAVMAFPLEIPIYYREHFSFVYRSDTYYLSKFLNELPLYLLLPAIHAVIIYYMIGFGCDGSNFLVFLLIIVLVSNAAYSVGHILSIMSSDVSVAVGLTAPVIAIQMLFSGFFLKKALRTPKWLSYIKYVSIFNYGYDLLLINQWENSKNVRCEYDMEILCLMTGNAVIDHHKVVADKKWLYIGLLFLLAFSFRAIAFTILWMKGRKNPLQLSSITRCGPKKLSMKV